jgi:hypothetical protein
MTELELMQWAINNEVSKMTRADLIQAVLSLRDGLNRSGDLIDAVLGTVPIAVRKKWPNVYKNASDFARIYRNKEATP